MAADGTEHPAKNPGDEWGGAIVPEYLPAHITQARAISAAPAMGRSLEQVEQDHIRQVLESTGNNRAQAARALGISPVTLWRKLKNEKKGNDPCPSCGPTKTTGKTRASCTATGSRRAPR